MTPYENVINRFIKKIKKDKEFFSYANTTEAETLAIINQRGKELLQDASDELQSLKSLEQNVDFLNRDEVLETYLFDLTTSEEILISELMVVNYFEETSVRLKELQKYLGDGIKVFSPNEERKTFMNLLKYKHTLFDSKLSDYNSIDRNTGKFLMPY